MVPEAFRQNGQKPGLSGSEEEEELPQCLAGPLWHFSLKLSSALWPRCLPYAPSSLLPACLPILLSSSPFPYGAPCLPYRCPPLFSISLSRIGGLSFGSIKTSLLTDSHGQWCLGKRVFRGSSWGLPLAQWIGAPPIPLISGYQPTPEGTPQSLCGCLCCANPPWALAAELRSLRDAQASSSPLPYYSMGCFPTYPRLGVPQQQQQPLCPDEGWEWTVPWPACW